MVIAELQNDPEFNLYYDQFISIFTKPMMNTLMSNINTFSNITLTDVKYQHFFKYMALQLINLIFVFIYCLSSLFHLITFMWCCQDISFPFRSQNRSTLLVNQLSYFILFVIYYMILKRIPSTYKDLASASCQQHMKLPPLFLPLHTKCLVFSFSSLSHALVSVYNSVFSHQVKSGEHAADKDYCHLLINICSFSLIYLHIFWTTFIVLFFSFGYER